MDQPGHRRKAAILWGVILLAILFISLLGYLKTFTRNMTLDGAIGVILGLYLCSHPAANLVDMIFFERGAGFRALTRRSALGWLALNLAAFLAGWLVIVNGTTRFITRLR